MWNWSEPQWRITYLQAFKGCREKRRSITHQRVALKTSVPFSSPLITFRVRETDFKMTPNQFSLSGTKNSKQVLPTHLRPGKEWIWFQLSRNSIVASTQLTNKVSCFKSMCLRKADTLMSQLISFKLPNILGDLTSVLECFPPNPWYKHWLTLLPAHV